MSLAARTKSILKKYDLKPVHHRGQNFLVQEAILDKIIDSADLSKKDTVLEVGPGLGFLTEWLVVRAEKVIAVELDKNLVKILNEEFRGIDTLEIVGGNILKFSPQEHGLKNYEYKVVANLPYNITSRFIRIFLENKSKPKEMVLMIQKEVAARIMAKPGQMSMLSLSCQFYAICNIEFLVKRGNFLPVPKVDSAVIKLKLKDKLPDVDEKKLFEVASVGFSSKRKKLLGNLSKGLQIKKDQLLETFSKLDFKEGVRAQELSVEDWIKLTLELKK